MYSEFSRWSRIVRIQGPQLWGSKHVWMHQNKQTNKHPHHLFAGKFEVEFARQPPIAHSPYLLYAHTCSLNTWLINLYRVYIMWLFMKVSRESHTAWYFRHVVTLSHNWLYVLKQDLPEMENNMPSFYISCKLVVVGKRGLEDNWQWDSIFYIWKR